MLNVWWVFVVFVCVVVAVYNRLMNFRSRSHKSRENRISELKRAKFASNNERQAQENII